MKSCIMVVDEVGIVKIEMTDLLKNYPFEIVHVKNGIEAINYLRLHYDRVKLILWSYVSQDYSDFEIIKNIKSKNEYQNIPIAIISKLSDKRYIIKAIEAGVNEFIVKPYDIETVLKKINKLLGYVLDSKTGPAFGEVLEYNFNDMLSREIKAAGRGNHPLTILLVSIVGSKQEPIKSEDIKTFVKVLRTRLRETDSVYPYGVNSIIILLPFCNKAGSIVVDQKVRNIFKTSSLMKSMNVNAELVITSVTYPDDGKIKEQLLEKLTKNLGLMSNSSPQD